MTGRIYVKMLFLPSELSNKFLAMKPDFKSFLPDMTHCPILELLLLPY